MKSFIDSLLTALAILLFIPTLLILISWNAIPGDSLYPVKGWFEDVALAVTIKTPLASVFSIKFTERRFSEANRLLAKRGSTLGYTLLVAEAAQSKDIIIDKNDSKSASELIVKIEEYQKNLEEKKVVVKTTSQTIAYIPTNPTPISQIVTKSPFPTHIAQTPYPQQTSQSIFQTMPAPTPAPSTDQVVVDLETTNVELEKIKDELKNRVPSHIREEERRKEDKRGESKSKRKETQNPTPVETLTPTSTPLTTTPFSTSTPTGGEY